MAKWKVDLEWYAMNHDFNRDNIEFINVLNRDDIKEAIKKAYQKGNWRLDNKPIKTLKDLKEVLRGELMCHYWSKAEYEVMVGGLFSKMEELEKKDVWSQLEPNLDRIAEYVNNAMQLGLK